MNFSSIPAYLDPSNWQQQSGSTIQNHHHQQQLTSAPPPSVLPPPPVVPLQPHGGGGAGSIRPGSMADRARMANIPMPETALKCPRCDSANTKFCYFNNYSLSQPRHFCKACKRYWTRGGALRSVPVGGGCRRNKRSNNNNKNSNNNNNNNNSFKSPASSTSTDGRQGTNNSGSSTTISSHSNSFSGPASATSLLGLMSPQIPPLRFMSPLGQFSSDHHHHHHFTPSNHMNLNFSTSSCGNIVGGTTEGMMVNNNNMLGAGAGAGAGAGVGAGVGVGGHVASLLSSGNLEHWRMQQQFPNFLGGFDPSNSPSSYPFQGGVHEAVQYLGGESTSQISRPKISTSMLNQMASVKMEDNNNNSNNNNNNNNQDQSSLSRQLLGIQGNNENWNTSASSWSDLSASFSSSSTSNAL